MMIPPCTKLAIAGALALSLVVTTAGAANTWDGGSSGPGDNNWGTANNWDNNLVPTFPVALTFAGSTRLTPNNNLSSLTVNGITFAAAAGAFVLSGNAITLGGNIGFSGTPAAPITQTINMDIIMSGSRQFSSSGANGTLVVNGNISESSAGFGLIKGQLGTLVLSGNNSFTGPLDNRAGIISVNTLSGSGTNSAIGAGSQINFGASAGATATILTYTGGGNATVNRTILLASSVASASGTIVNNGSGVLTFNGVFTNSAAQTNGTKSFTLGGTNNGANDFQSAIANSVSNGVVSVSKVGSGRWILSGSNTYTGGTILDAGRLILASTNALGTGTLTINGGTLDSGTADLVNANNNAVVINSDFIFAGTEKLNLGTAVATLGTAVGTTRTINTTGSAANLLTLGGLTNGTTATNLTKDGTGRLDIVTGVNSFITGNLTLNSGTTVVQNTNIGTPLTVSAALQINGASTRFQTSDSVNASTIYNGPVTGDGQFRVFSQGQAVLGGDNSAFTGQMNIFRFAKLNDAKGLGGASTTLQLDRSYEDSYVDLNGLAVTGVNATFTTLENGGVGGSRLARLRNDNTSTAASFAGNITTTLSNNVGVDGLGNMTLSGVISGSNGLTKLGVGTLVLSGTNTYTGATTVSAGSLIVNGNQSAATGVLSVSSGATLGGSGTIGGATTISGTLSPGNSIGTLTFANNLTLGGSSTSGFEINGFTAGFFDLVSGGPGSQTVTFGGTLNLTFNNNFSTEGSVNIFNFENYSGVFNSVNTAGLAAGYSAMFDSLSGTVNVVPEPSTYALLALAAAGLGAHVVRRRRSSR